MLRKGRNHHRNHHRNIAVAVIAAVALMTSLRRGGKSELSANYLTNDRQLVAEEAASLRSTIAAAQGGRDASSLFPASNGMQMDAANVPLGADLARADPGQSAIAAAQEQLRRVKRAALRASQIQADSAEEARLEKKVQRERVEYTRIALKERANEGEKEAVVLQKQLLSRELHLEHLERERRWRAEARAEMLRAKRWTQHHAQVGPMKVSDGG